MTNFDKPSRRGALKCLAFGGAGTLFALSGGVFAPIDLTVAAETQRKRASAGALSFVGSTSPVRIASSRGCSPTGTTADWVRISLPVLAD